MRELNLLAWSSKSMSFSEFWWIRSGRAAPPRGVRLEATQSGDGSPQSKAPAPRLPLDCGESASASPLWEHARNSAAKAAPIPRTVRMRSGRADGWMDSEQDAPCTVWSGTLQLRRVAGDGLPATESGDGSPQSKAPARRLTLDCGESASASPLWEHARNPAANAAPIPPTVRQRSGRGAQYWEFENF